MSTDRRDPSQGLEWKEVHQGVHPGDQFVRIARHRAFKKLGSGRYELLFNHREQAISSDYHRYGHLGWRSEGLAPERLPR